MLARIDRALAYIESAWLPSVCHRTLPSPIWVSPRHRRRDGAGGKRGGCSSASIVPGLYPKRGWPPSKPLAIA